MTLELRPYQVIGRDFLTEAGRGVLADEPGVGKTPTALQAAEGRTLIVAPAALQDVWYRHLPLWSPDLDATVTSYSSLCAREESPKTGRMTKVTPYPRPELVGPWDTVICDEAHYLKERGTTWTKALRRIKTEQLFLLTGSPLPNWAHEVYMLLVLLYPGDPRFSNYWRWVRRWFKVWEPPWGGWQIRGLKHPGPGGWRAFADGNGIPGHWLRRKLDDVLPDLPPMTGQTIEVEMVPKQAAVYKRLKKEAYATLPDTGAEVISWSDGGVWGKMLQCSMGLETLDDREKGSGKLAVLEELLRDRQRPTIVFCHYRLTAEAVGRLSARMGLTFDVIHGGCQEAIGDRLESFQGGGVAVLAGTLGMLAEGWTLTAADTCVFLERHPRPSVNEQARRRIRRFGQERPTLAIDLVTPGTVDADLVKLLAEKDDSTLAALTGFDLAVNG